MEIERTETETKKEKKKERDEETNNLNKTNFNKIVAYATYELQDEWEIFWDLGLNKSFLSDC